MRFDRLAELLEYPKEDRAGSLNARCDVEALYSPQATPHLKSFCSAIENYPLDTRQEMFVRTFDLNPDCALEIGWHLFGEDYKRGEMLAYLRGEMRSAGVEEGNELPDHLGNILKLLGRWNSEDDANQFVRLFVMPVLEKLEKAIPQTETPYLHLIRAVREACCSEFSLAVEYGEAEFYPCTPAESRGFSPSGATP